MNERDCTTWLEKELRLRLYRCWIIKHNEQNLRGVPDLSISIRRKGGTGWVEVKLAGENGRFKPTRREFELLQNETLANLEDCGPAAYAVFVPVDRGRRMIVIDPARIRSAITEKYYISVVTGTIDGDVTNLVELLLGADPKPNWEITC